MRRGLYLVLAILFVVGGFLPGPALAQSTPLSLDLADIPLPIQDLPEDGYQILAGDYLSADDTAELIAAPRNLDQQETTSSLDSVGLERVYVLDLVLPEDRADANAAILAVIQTSVYELDSDSTDPLVAMLTDFSGIRSVTERSSEYPSVSIIGPGGDSIRTVVTSGNIVFEVVSLDATGEPDATAHDLIVDATLARVSALQDAENVGLSSPALTVTPTIAFAHQQQTGQHGLYRLRDGVVQPAIGELGAERSAVPDGLVQQYIASNVSPAATGTGISVTTVILSRYGSEEEASAALTEILAGDIGDAAADPFFPDQDGGTYTQVSPGLYAVSGTVRGDASSGFVQIVQEQDVIVVVGLRAVGSTLARQSTLSQMVDQQLACLAENATCAPFAMPLPEVTPATPLAERGHTFSSRFGWMLPALGPDWSVTDEMTDSGYDMIELQNGQSLATLESVINHNGDPVQCVLDELHNLQEFEEHADIRLWKDADGATDAGSDRSHAWSTWRVEPLADERADQEYVIRVDCYRLITPGVNLVVSHTAPVDVWQAEQPKGDEIRNAIAFPVNQALHGRLAITPHDRRIIMIDFHWIDRAA